MGIIRIDNLEVFANHGVLKEEKILGQKFIISVDMQQDITEAAKNDDISKSTNYAEVCEFIQDFSQKECYNLIETLADRLAMGILKEFPLLNSVKVEVKKPNAPIKMHFDCVSVTVERKWSEAYISVGSNMGDKQGYISAAIDAIENDEMCKIHNISSLIETKPYGNTDQDDFLNGCICIKTLYSPQELLAFLQKTEYDNGRVRNIHWGPRTLDLDILMYDNSVIFEDNLIVPHPDMTNREFVLQPLCEIAPYLVHPLERKTILELFKQL